MTPKQNALLDKLLPLLEAFAASRAQQTELRRAMRARRCAISAGFVLGSTGEPVPPCYDKTRGRTPWCEECRAHDTLFARLMAERKANKRRQAKLERLAVAFAAPEPPEPEEPKELLALMEPEA